MVLGGSNVTCTILMFQRITKSKLKRATWAFIAVPRPIKPSTETVGATSDLEVKQNSQNQTIVRRRRAHLNFHAPDGWT